MTNSETQPTNTNLKPSKSNTSKPWYKKKRFIIPLAIVAFIFFLAINTDTENSTTPTDNEAVSETEESKSDNSSSTQEDNSNLTAPQRNAVRSAQSYISFAGFSRQGLIDQLSSEAGDKYSVGDATAAVDSLEIDYNEQAKRSAESYLKMSGFSCQGLIDQLSSGAGDKYTLEQARAGAEAAGAC